jgi:hypothetical protein
MAIQVNSDRPDARGLAAIGFAMAFLTLVSAGVACALTVAEVHGADLAATSQPGQPAFSPER